MPRQVTTRDLGIMIRDFIEGRLIVEGKAGPVMIDMVDVSDADNAIVYLENGQTFTVRIIAR